MGWSVGLGFELVGRSPGLRACGHECDIAFSIAPYNSSQKAALTRSVVLSAN